MSRLSNIGNLSDAVRKRLCGNCMDVYDYNVCMESSANTQLIVRCVIRDTNAKQADILLKSFYFRIRFNSADISKELQEALHYIDINDINKGSTSYKETKIKVFIRLEKYLSDYFNGKVTISEHEIIDFNNILIFDFAMQF